MIVTNELLTFLNLLIIQTNNGLIYSFSDSEVGNKKIDSLEKNLTQVCFKNGHRAEDILEETRGLRIIALLDLTDSPNLAAPIVSVIEGFRGEPQVYKINGFCNHEVEWNYSVAHDVEICQQWDLGASRQVEPRNEFRWTQFKFGGRKTFALDENTRDECDKTIGFVALSREHLRFTQVLSELFADPLCLVQCKTSKYRRQDEGQPIRSIDRCANCGSCTTCPNNLTASKCYGGGCQTEPDDLSKAFARVPTKPMLWWAFLALSIVSAFLGTYLIYTQFNYILLFRNLSIIMTTLLLGSTLALSHVKKTDKILDLFCKITMSLHSLITVTTPLDGPHQNIMEIYLLDKRGPRSIRRGVIALTILLYSLIFSSTIFVVGKILKFPYSACELELNSDWIRLLILIGVYLSLWLLANCYSRKKIPLKQILTSMAESILFVYLFVGPVEISDYSNLQWNYFRDSSGLIVYNFYKGALAYRRRKKEDKKRREEEERRREKEMNTSPTILISSPSCISVESRTYRPDSVLASAGGAMTMDPIQTRPKDLSSTRSNEEYVTTFL